MDHLLQLSLACDTILNISQEVFIDILTVSSYSILPSIAGEKTFHLYQILISVGHNHLHNLPKCKNNIQNNSLSSLKIQVP